MSAGVLKEVSAPKDANGSDPGSSEPKREAAASTPLMLLDDNLEREGTRGGGRELQMVDGGAVDGVIPCRYLVSFTVVHLSSSSSRHVTTLSYNSYFIYLSCLSTGAEGKLY